MNSIVYFPLSLHRRVFIKFLVLVFFVNLPLLLMAASGSAPDYGVATGYIDDLTTHFSSPSQFIYVVTFFSPFVYIIVDKFIKAKADDEDLKNTKFDVFDGYLLNLFIAAILMFVASFSFGVIQTDLVWFTNSYLGKFVSGGFDYIYLYALYCWYLTMLDDAYDGSQLISASADREKEKVNKLSQRVQAGS